MALKLKAHGVKTKKEEPVKELTLGILPDADGVVIAAVDDDGKAVKGGQLVRITNCGMLVRLPAVSADLGVKRNKKNQILEKIIK